MQLKVCYKRERDVLKKMQSETGFVRRRIAVLKKLYGRKRLGCWSADIKGVF